MRALIKKLLRQLTARHQLTARFPLILCILFLLFAGILAVTQEGDNYELQDAAESDLVSGFDEEAGELYDIPEEGMSERAAPERAEFEWMPPGPPRWFRSNAGGMALEEMPSRLTALRNEYALVIDYLSPDELDPFLVSFYRNAYSVEIRILFFDREESRKQWLFKDESGNVRVNAVFRQTADSSVDETQTVRETEDKERDDEVPDITASLDTDAPADDERDVLDIAAGTEEKNTAVTTGFIEIFNDNFQISEDYNFTGDGNEIMTTYFYNENMLIKAEIRQRNQNEESADYQIMYTDTYRYNRSYSLRNVERVFYEQVNEPVLLLFPGRVLDIARDKDFIKEKVSLLPDFFDSYSADKNYRIVYDTDERGRIITQTMFDNKNKEVWVIRNTWIGDRIVSILKIENGDERLTEYEYDSAGERTAQRDMRNGVLERQVLTNGNKETEELFMNGVVILRAFWEDGRKISEERVRRR